MNDAALRRRVPHDERTPDDLLKQIYEEFGDSSFSKEDVHDSFGILAGRDCDWSTRKINNALAELVERELLQERDQDEFVVTHAGVEFVENDGDASYP